MKQREEWLKEAVNLINRDLFGGELTIDQYQIAFGWCKSARAMGETIYPYEGEDVEVDDFFPKTIHIDIKLKEPETILATLAHEMIHCFKGIKGHRKAFAIEAHKIGFEDPVKEYHPSESLLEICRDIAVELGDYDGAPIVVRKKAGASRKRKGLLFCPQCGFECRAKEKDINAYGIPTCACGTKMGLACEDEDIKEGESTNEQ